MQIDIDPGPGRESAGAAIIESLVRTHFALGGTQINMNVVDAKRVAGGAPRTPPVPGPGGPGHRVQRVFREPLSEPAAVRRGPDAQGGRVETLPHGYRRSFHLVPLRSTTRAAKPNGSPCAHMDSGARRTARKEEDSWREPCIFTRTPILAAARRSWKSPPGSRSCRRNWIGWPRRARPRVAYWSGGNLYPGVLEAAAQAGLSVMSDYKNPRRQESDPRLLAINPWRPAGGPKEGDLAAFARHDAAGKIIYLPDGIFSRVNHAGMRRSAELGGDLGLLRFPDRGPGTLAARRPPRSC